MKVDEAITTAWRTAAAHQYTFNPTDFLASLRANGFVVVPVEPTEAMQKSVIDAWQARYFWSKMLAAAVTETDDGR